MKLLHFACSAILACVSVADTDEPQRAEDLGAPIRINAADGPIDVAGFASPYFGDFRRGWQTRLARGAT